MKKLLALLIFLFIIPISASAQIVSIGVQPSEITYDSYRIVTMKFWNSPADTDAEFWVSFENMTGHYICDWCAGHFIVPNNTDRTTNPIIRNIVFTKEPNEAFNAKMYVNAKPVGATNTGMVSIEPRVGIKIFAVKATTTTTSTTTTTTTTQPTTTTQNSGNTPTTTTTQQSGNWWNFLFATTTTSTTTTTQPITTTTSPANEPTLPLPWVPIPTTTTSQTENEQNRTTNPLIAGGTIILFAVGIGGLGFGLYKLVKWRMEKVI